jgi:polyketide cyclase/dehydrase/lipid transport protein
VTSRDDLPEASLAPGANEGVETDAFVTPADGRVSSTVRVFIRREPDAVFDYVADLRNEPQYNGQVSAITKTSPGPVGHGTTFVGLHRGFGPVSWQLSEYERPSHVAIEGRVGKGIYRWTSDFESASGGTVMCGRMEWQPPERWRPFRALLGVILGWNARRSFGRMAALLARGTPAVQEPDIVR